MQKWHCQINKNINVNLEKRIFQLWFLYKTDFSKIIFTKEAYRATREIPNERDAKMKNRDEEEFNFSINHQRQLG